MKLHTLLPPYGKKNKKRRVGRGDSAGQGSHSGKGMSGEKSRSGRVHYLGFEGGQMPLYRRLPKRGFTPLSKEKYQEVNLYSLNKLADKKEITPEVLYEEGLINKKDGKVKILGGGAIEVVLIVKAHKFSKRAKEEIIKKGGSIIEIGRELKSDKREEVKKKKELKRKEEAKKKEIEKETIQKEAEPKRIEQKTEQKEIKIKIKEQPKEEIKEEKEKKVEKVEVEKVVKKEAKVEPKEKKIAKKEKTVKGKKVVKSKEKDKIKTKGKKKSKPR